MSLTLKGFREAAWFIFDDGLEVKVAEINSQRYSIGIQQLRTYYTEKRTRLLEKTKDKDGNLRYDDSLVEVADDEKSELTAQYRLMSKYLILGMRDTGRDDGKFIIDDEPYEYSPELGEKLLANNTDFFFWVLDKARGLKEESGKMVQSVEKKPATGSGGKASGAGKAGARQSKRTTQ